jgi:hypothetical protein
MRALLVVLGITIWLVAAAWAQEERPSAVDTAQRMFDGGDYPACLKQVGFCLRATTNKPTPKERCELLMLRGECLLRMKQEAGAAAAFESASNVLKVQGDVPAVASAKANAVLTRASPGLKYKAAGGSAEGIDIVDPTSRKQAIQALHQERKATVTPEVEQALKGTSLPAMQKLLPASWELYALEFSASGDAPETTIMIRKMGAHARELIDNDMKRISGRLDELDDLASEPTLGAGAGASAGAGTSAGAESAAFRGLSSAERDELAALTDDLVKMQRVLELGRRLNRLFGGTGEIWDALLADCAETRNTAQRMSSP